MLLRSFQDANKITSGSLGNSGVILWDHTLEGHSNIEDEKKREDGQENGRKLEGSNPGHRDPTQIVEKFSQVTYHV